MVDWQKVVLLLDIIQKAAIAGPAYNWFASRASMELLQMQPTADKLMVAPVKESRPAFAPAVDSGGKNYE